MEFFSIALLRLHTICEVLTPNLSQAMPYEMFTQKWQNTEKFRRIPF